MESRAVKTSHMPNAVPNELESRSIHPASSIPLSSALSVGKQNPLYQTLGNTEIGVGCKETVECF